MSGSMPPSTFAAACSRVSPTPASVSLGPPYFCCLLRQLSWMSVRTKPGHSTETPIPRGASCAAQPSLIATTANLVAQ